MSLYLTEDDVKQLLTMPEAIDAVEEAFLLKGAGDAANHPRERFFLPKGVMHHMAASFPLKGYMGTKTYTSFKSGTRFWVTLYSADTGDLLAIIEGNRLGQMRTGAATGVAAKYMARQDTTAVTLLGTGWQAQAQAEALISALPNLRLFQVFSRNVTSREQFCRQQAHKFGVRFLAMTSAEEASRSTGILVCATSSSEPILKAEWISNGDFVAAVGANRLTAREIDEELIGKVHRIVVDDLVQAKAESGELVHAYEKRKFRWEQAYELSEVVAGRVVGRNDPTEITLFKSLGIALEDIAVAAVVYEKAKKQGIGQALPGGARS